jgi:phosphatidylserine decarboxylase
MSIKQGKKYDDPASRSQIEAFVEFHKLDMSEVLLPIEEFKTFNQFFYRALKPNARPCSAPDNPRIIVSPADCRSIVFNTIDDATGVWVKGREFSVRRLLGDAYPEDAKRYENGALGIFRLAPQDYHRFHIPVDGIMGEPKTIAGEYYTVNPMAIRSALDVYGENVRVLVPIDSPEHGRVMVICVGAMMVGSTVITRGKGGEHVKRADELGYFKFGGSTIVLLFEGGKMVFDDDLVYNSSIALETLVGSLVVKEQSGGGKGETNRLFRSGRACPLGIPRASRSGCLTCPRTRRTLPRRTSGMRSGGSRAVSRHRIRPRTVGMMILSLQTGCHHPGCSRRTPVEGC